MLCRETYLLPHMGQWNTLLFPSCCWGRLPHGLMGGIYCLDAHGLDTLLPEANSGYTPALTDP